ncbi:hypothetical protein [Acinetobacter colistiniresistens]|uniref:hypothetical protein n=1 Tax=Acinetobacter colistiniresistens TaxID=280145 RepID=UPI00124FFF03|nr:hypothetical protein [Acinetobacter colistiniresistens]
MDHDVVFEGLTTELFKANAIIAHAMTLMSEEQKQDLYRRCFIDRIVMDDGDELHFKRREVLVKQAKGVGVQVCRKCGCTDTHGCIEGCWWKELDLCSECANVDDYVEKRNK